MSEEAEFELVRGSGNVFRDFEDPDADLKQAKAVLAANIIAALDERQLTVREANRLTGFAAADFSRVRNANLGRFTLDRLMRMFSALDSAGVAIRVDNGRQETVRSIVIDKSYAQGEPAALSRLQNDWNLIFPDAFLFEVASTDPKARRWCLNTLRQLNREGTVSVGPNVGALLRNEISTLTAAGPPSENLLFGIGLDAFLTTNFDRLSRAQRHVLDQTNLEFAKGAMSLVAMAATLRTLFPNAARHDWAYRQARDSIANDHSFITRFLVDVVREGDSPQNAPLWAAIAGSRKFGPDWTIYRWLQVHLLYALERARRHDDVDLHALTSGQRKKLENETTDMDYLVLGLLQGAIATKDRKLGERFSILNPNGTLIP